MIYKASVGLLLTKFGIQVRFVESSLRLVEFKFAFCGIQVCIERIKFAFLRIQVCIERIKFEFQRIQVCIERIKLLSNRCELRHTP